MAADYVLTESLVSISDNTDYDNIMIGNSHFTDDEWDLKPFITKKTLPDNIKYIRFNFIPYENIKFTVKQYAYYKLGTIKAQTVRDYINSRLPNFVEYCLLNEITSFCDITQNDFLQFNIWLKNTKNLSAGAGYHSSHVVEDLIKTGQIKGWNVPQNNIFRGISSCQLWYSKNNFKKNKTKPIPEDVFNKILYHAVNDEKDVLTKAGIIIQSQTGLRINEVLSIQEGCVKRNADGYEYMEVELSKTEKGEPIIHKVFINELVSQAIAELSEYTKDLRKESDLKELFLYKANRCRNIVGVYKVMSWNPSKLTPFIERWDIRNNKGNLYPLKSHQFRATFVRELVKRKVPIAMIMKQYSHVSIEMTAHYLTLQSEEVKNIYADMVLSPEAKIAGLRAKEIKGKLNTLFNGKTEEQISDVIEDLAQTMSFNPLPTGVCLYDFRRMLWRVGTKHEKSKTGFISEKAVYRCESCENCTYRQNCTKAKSAKTITVSHKFKELRNESQENITTDFGKRLRMNRSIQSEGAFGVLKEDYSFRRFLCRGRNNIKTEFLLLALAYNIKKLSAKILSNRLGISLFDLKSA